MNKSISLCTHLIILGVLICMTTALSIRHKRNAISEFKWPEPDPNTDHFAHESSCHHYYLVISEEDITINKCPHGELFDYVEHECKDKESARCWSHHFGKKHHHIALKSRGSFTCPYAWGKYPDINNCTKYYTCLAGKAKHKKCAPFEHFDKISRKCVGTIFGMCADKTDVVERDFKCPKNWGSFSFHKDCSKYYECLERQPNLRTCPIDTLFHAKKQKCVPKNHVHCGSRHNPYRKEDETSTTAKFSFPENIPLTSNEFKELSIESETISDEISSKVETNKEEVRSSSMVSQTTQAPTDVSGSTPNEPRSIESEAKLDVNISSEADVNPNGDVNPTSKVSQTSQTSKVLQTSQTPKELTAEEISNNGSDPTPKEIKDFTNTPSKEFTSNETKSLIEHNTLKNNALNDTDEITDSLNTNEFIEVSTASETSVATASQTITVESSKKIDGSITEDKEDRKTTMESSQATPLDECHPKDYTCVTEEGGRVIRCPESDGIFPYPGDERRYLQCKKSKIRVKFCSGNLIFSYPQKKCISKFIF